MEISKVLKVNIKNFLYIFKKISKFLSLLDFREQTVDKIKFEYNLIKITKDNNLLKIIFTINKLFYYFIRNLDIKLINNYLYLIKKVNLELLIYSQNIKDSHNY